jgi:hypothetical protein
MSVERGSMMRSHRGAASGRRAGLAVPTAVAALVCGSTVLVIAGFSAGALDGGGAVAVGMAAPLDAVGAGYQASTVDGVASSGGQRSDGGADPASPGVAEPAGVRSSEASGLPATGPLRSSGAPADRSISDPGPSTAPTAAAVTVTVSGPGFDQPAVPVDGHGPLGAPRVVGAGDPTVTVVTPTPTPTPSAVPPSSSASTPTPTASDPSPTPAESTLTPTTTSTEPTGPTAGEPTDAPPATADITGTP